MADLKTVRDAAPKRDPHPAGQFAAVCVDVIDLGWAVEVFGLEDPKLVDKTALVFRTEALRDGAPLELAQEFSTSLGKKANLRKFLESWRGKPYTDDEARRDGIPLHKLCGVPALMTVAHKTSKAGNEYAIISSVVPLPKQMHDGAPSADGYVRAEFWTKKKAEYTMAADTFRQRDPGPSAAVQPTPETEFGDYPADEDDLPF